MKFVAWFLMLASLLHARTEWVEAVAAVVDGKVILRSEVLQNVVAMQNSPGLVGLDENDLYKRVLQRMIDEKVVLTRARIDSIMISDEEVKSRVESHIASLSSRQNATPQQLEQAIRAQLGISLSQYREQLSRQIREQMTVARVRARYVGVINPTRKEVEAFYAEYRDSLPRQYNSVRVAHLQIKVEPNSQVVDSVRTLAVRLLDSIVRGMPFEVIAQRHSQDASSAHGGDIGFFRRGALEPEYERALFTLDPGRTVDRPVRTRMGWHLIKATGRRDDEMRSSQILLQTKPTVQDSQRVILLLDSLRKRVELGDSFGNLATIFSQDLETRHKGGDLGWFERGELDSAYQKVVANLRKGELSQPALINDSWHIFQLSDEAAERELDIDQDFLRIKDMATMVLGNRRLLTFVERWRREVFIDIRS